MTWSFFYFFFVQQSGLNPGQLCLGICTLY
jgi:hypothetical protein